MAKVQQYIMFDFHVSYYISLSKLTRVNLTVYLQNNLFYEINSVLFVQNINLKHSN